jgi:hypothetical protein
VPPIHDLNGHALLQGAAARLDAGALAAHTEVAERLLGVRARFTNPDDADAAENALALQVSLQAEGGVDAVIASSIGRGSRSVGYRESTRLHPDAVTIIGELNAKYGRVRDRYRTVRSVRNDSDFEPGSGGTGTVFDERRWTP